MPLYEYRCSQCGKVFETIQKFADAPLTVHEECGGSVERLISAPSLQFKGSGWYVNDYPKNAHPAKGEGKSESKSEGKTDGGSGGSSDTKSENKSDSRPDNKSDSKPADSASKTESKPSSSNTSKE